MTPTGTPLLSWDRLSHSGDELEHVLLLSARPILDRGRSQIDIVSRGVAQIVDLIVVQQVGTPFFNAALIHGSGGAAGGRRLAYSGFGAFGMQSGGPLLFITIPGVFAPSRQR